MNQNIAVFNSSKELGPVIPSHELPPEFMVVSNNSWVIIVIASIIFVCGSVGNVCTVVSLKRLLRRRYSSMHHLLLHMCYTELLVVFVTIPLDIAWRLSIGWYAGNFACKIANFSRCCIYFLSSFVLICMSIDCFCNVFCSGRISRYGSKRVRWLVISAWLFALVSAAPKFYLSYVRAHPVFTPFSQCLLESAAPFFSVYPLIESYFSPLIVVIITYTPTFFRLCRHFEKASNKDEVRPSVSNPESFDTFKIEGVKLTFAFALVVIICYTPQILLISLYYLCPNFQSSSTEEMILYILESSKSVMIPVVYFILRGKNNVSPLPYDSHSIEF